MDAERPPLAVCLMLLAGALLVGGFLLVDAALASSATYDEVAYLEIAATWWREGSQERIARMGSPTTFFKIQQGPVFWALDRVGFGHLVDDPIRHQSALLPLVRIGSLWIWATGLALTAAWAGMAHGRYAMVFAAWMMALSPNLIAHGSLVTMESPLVACAAAVGLLFTRFLATGSNWAFVGGAAVSGLAFSCKFTAILFPLLLGATWICQISVVEGDYSIRRLHRGAAGCAVFLVLMGLSNFVVTGGARLPISEQIGRHPAIEARLGTNLGRFAGWCLETPIPQDWAAFVRQLQHQRGGGPSYLLGERRQSGWWYYYLVCLAVKVPLTFWCLVAVRGWLGFRRGGSLADRLATTWVVATMVLVALGSSRNYGYRYVLFLAPAAIVWVSMLPELGRRGRIAAILGLLGQAAAVGAIHPHELSYFNQIVGGPEGGKYVLADSNLDWGQGARQVAALQRAETGFQDLTWFYFGDTDPAHYGVKGAGLQIDAHGPRSKLPDAPEAVESRFVAISRSLQFGPWGPDGYFEPFDEIAPIWISRDHSVAIYQTKDAARGAGRARDPFRR